MEIKRHLDKGENYLKRYRLLIGVAVFIMVVVLSIQIFIFFDKQNQIIETGGYVDDKIKCVCTQEAWDQFIARNDIIYNISVGEINKTDG